MPGRNNPFCTKCNRFAKTYCNGIYVIEHKNGKPVRIWSADGWRCPECEKKFISGFGSRPVIESHHPGWAKYMASIKKSIETAVCEI